MSPRPGVNSQPPTDHSANFLSLLRARLQTDLLRRRLRDLERDVERESENEEWDYVEPPAEEPITAVFDFLDGISRSLRPLVLFKYLYNSFYPCTNNDIFVSVICCRELVPNQETSLI